MKKLLACLLVVAILFSLTGCFEDLFGEEPEDAVSADLSDRLVQPNQWYHYKELSMVNFQNCAVSDAFIRNSGGVFVTYYPVCADCGETGTSGVAIVSEDEPYLKNYTCDCGARTGVIIKIFL